MLTFYEFFAGGGMARLGLGPAWCCLFANDIDPMKTNAYAANFGAAHLKLGDVGQLTTADLPGRADLAWASFPCQDVSLAGKGAGLKGVRSGMFWAFWRLVEGLCAEGRGPRVIALENVIGLLTSHGGRDFAAIGDVLAGAGYRFGAMVLDAASFVPQSRPRLFIVAVRGEIGGALQLGAPDPVIHTRALRDAVAGLSKSAAPNWMWWRVPLPPTRNIALADLIEDDPTDVAWLGLAETQRLLGMMTPHNLAKVQARQMTRRRSVGAIYKRTRLDAQGVKHQRAEVRFDDLSGCLRTPSGGSSRQTILVVEGNKVRARLLSGREAARLMGLPDDYKLPAKYNDAYHLAGDGVAAPVVRHLAANLLEPLLSASALREAAA